MIKANYSTELVKDIVNENSMNRGQLYVFNKSKIDEYTNDWDIEVDDTEDHCIHLNHEGWKDVYLDIPSDLMDRLYELEDGMFYELGNFKKVSDLPFCFADILAYNVDNIISSYMDLRLSDVKNIIRWLKPICNFDVYNAILEHRSNFTKSEIKKQQYIISELRSMDDLFEED